MKLKNIFYFDLFSYNPKLTYFGKSSHKSYVGVLFSYIYVLFLLMTTINFGNDVFYRENPTVVITETKFSNFDSPEIFLSPNDIRIGFGIYESNSLIPLDESYFNIKGKQLIIRKKNDFAKYQYIERNFKMIQCPLNRVPREPSGALRSELAKNSSFPLFLCMDSKFETTISEEPVDLASLDEKGFYIKGFFGSEEYTQIRVFYSKCENSTNATNNIVCKSQEEIDDKINKIYVGGALANKFVQPQIYKDPIKENFEWIYSKTCSNFTKELISSMQKSELISDDGYVMSDVKKDSFFTLSSHQESLTKPVDNTFMVLSFQINGIKKDYIRRYKKIQGLAAEVGGVMKILLVFLALLIKPLVFRSFRLAFIENVFGLGPNPEGRQPDKRETFNFRAYLPKKSGVKTQPKTNSKDLNLAFKFIERKIDVSNLFKKVFELEKLIRIIFDKNQETLFRSLCRSHRIELKKKFKSGKTLDEGIDRRFTRDEKEVSYIDAFRLMSKRLNEESVIEKNLLQLLSEKIRDDVGSMAEFSEIEVDEFTVRSDLKRAPPVFLKKTES